MKLTIENYKKVKQELFKSGKRAVFEIPTFQGTKGKEFVVKKMQTSKPPVIDSREAYKSYMRNKESYMSLEFTKPRCTRSYTPTAQLIGLDYQIKEGEQIND